MKLKALRLHLGLGGDDRPATGDQDRKSRAGDDVRGKDGALIGREGPFQPGVLETASTVCDS